ncbi:MAG: hypothetical protein AAFX93_20000 [Verrucomicrobiota bacterium]
MSTARAALTACLVAGRLVGMPFVIKTQFDQYITLEHSSSAVSGGTSWGMVYNFSNDIADAWRFETHQAAVYWLSKRGLMHISVVEVE